MGSRGIRSGPLYNPPTERQFDSHGHYGGLSSVGPAQAQRVPQGQPSYRDGGAQPGLRYNVHPPSPQTHRRTHTQPVLPPSEDLFARAQASRARFEDREYLDQQRMGITRNQLRPVHISDTAVHQTEFEDDRLIISWVDESELIDPPAAPPTRPSLGVVPPSHPGSYLSDGETLLGSGYPGRSPNDRVSSGGSYGFPVTHSGYPAYESDSDSAANPTPAIPTPPPEWPAPRDSLHPGPSRTSYPSLPIPPTTVAHDPQTESPVEEEPRPEFKESFELIHKNDAAGYLQALSRIEMDRSDAERALRKLNHAVQVQFEERQGIEKVNRVVIIPRNRPALATNPKIDVDLIIPGDFVLHQWTIRPRPATVAHALGLDSTSLARSEISAGKLKHVVNAIWDQLDVGGRTDLQLEDGPDTHHLRLIAPGRVSVRINVFIKVATSIHGKDVLLGVDSNSALSGDKYQMIQTLPAPGVSFAPAPLSHVERIAILTLTWWQREIKQLPAGEGVTRPRLRTSHFMLALAALHQLDPTDELYLAPNGVGSKFSLTKVLETIEKVLKFMERAYESPFASSTSSTAESVKYPFPLACCTVTDALYTQATVNPDEPIQTTRLVLREMALGIHGTIEDVRQLEEKARKERKESGSLKEFELLAKVSGLLGRPATVRMSNQERFKHELEEHKSTAPKRISRSLTMAPGAHLQLSPVPESPGFKSPLSGNSLKTATGNTSSSTQGSSSTIPAATSASQSTAPVVTPPGDASTAAPASAPATTPETTPPPAGGPAAATADKASTPDNSSTAKVETAPAEPEKNPEALKDKADGQKDTGEQAKNTAKEDKSAAKSGADAVPGAPAPAGGAGSQAKQPDSKLKSG